MNKIPNITKNLIGYAHELRRKVEHDTAQGLENAIKGVESGQNTDEYFTLLMGLIRFSEISLYQDIQIETLQKDIDRFTA